MELAIQVLQISVDFEQGINLYLDRLQKTFIT